MSTEMVFPSASPASLGIPAASIEKYLDHVRDNNLEVNSLMIVRHGKKAAAGWWAPYAPDLLHAAHSLSKSITSAAIGLLIEEGKVALQDKVVDLFADELPETLPGNLDKMTLWHVLTMTCGHETEPVAGPGEDNYAKAFLSHPIPLEPGTSYLYNTMASYMLCLLLYRKTGQNLLEYLRPRVLDPIGIGGIFCLTCPRGIEHGGMGVYITTEDIARLAQLYLQKGRHAGRQLIPEAWIDESTAWQVDTSNHPAGDGDHTSGFGYHIWRCIPDNVYRFAGANGQFGIVVPEHDMVIAVTASSWNTAGITEGLWDILLPALADAPLPEDPEADARLKARLAGLAITWPDSVRDEKLEQRLDGRRMSWPDNRFSFSFRRGRPEQGVTETALSFSGDSATLAYTEGDASGTIRIALDGTKAETIQTYSGHDFPVLATGTCLQDGTYRIDMRSILNTASRVLYLKPDFLSGTVQVRVEFRPCAPDGNNPPPLELTARLTEGLPA